MFILEKNRKTVLKELILYIGITAFIALFGFVYEQFSHGVNSMHMWLAWHWPLGLGVGVYALLYFLPIKKVPGLISECVYNFGVAMLTVRAIFEGVLEIYGKTNSKMMMAYTIIAPLFIAVGIILFVIGLIFVKEDNNKQ